MERLPVEILERILDGLTAPKDLIALASASRWVSFVIAHHTRLWERVLPAALTCHHPADEERSPLERAQRLIYCKAHQYCYACEEQGDFYARDHAILLCGPCRGLFYYKAVTKTEALKEYCLREADLNALFALCYPNPHYKRAAPMQLYLEREVKAISDANFAGMGATREAYRLQKEAAAEARRLKKAAATRHREEVLLPRRRLLRRAQLLALDAELISVFACSDGQVDPTTNAFPTRVDASAKRIRARSIACFSKAHDRHCQVADDAISRGHGSVADACGAGRHL